MPNLRSSQQPGVLLIGPIGAKGGIASVIEALLTADYLQSRYRIHTIKSAVSQDGGLFSEVLTLLKAFAKTLGFAVFKREITIFHIHASSGPSFWRKAIFVTIGKAFRKKVIFHIHASQFDSFFVSNSHSVSRRLIFSVLRRCDRVIVLGEVWKRQLSEHVESEKIWVIRNPVVSASQIDKYSTHENPSDEHQTFRVIFIGLFIKSKGVYDLLDAIPQVIRECPHVKFILCGTGDEERTMHHVIQSQNLQEHVELPGWVESHDKHHRLQTADLFVLPSHNEGMPMALLEAIHAGLPVVCSSVGAIPEFIQDGVNGFLVHPGDSGALAERIVELVQNSEKRKQMSLNNSELSKQFNVDEISKEWDKIYKSIL